MATTTMTMTSGNSFSAAPEALSQLLAHRRALFASYLERAGRDSKLPEKVSDLKLSPLSKAAVSQLLKHFKDCTAPIPEDLKTPIPEEFKYPTLPIPDAVFHLKATVREEFPIPSTALDQAQEVVHLFKLAKAAKKLSSQYGITLEVAAYISQFFMVLSQFYNIESDYDGQHFETCLTGYPGDILREANLQKALAALCSPKNQLGTFSTLRLPQLTAVLHKIFQQKCLDSLTLSEHSSKEALRAQIEACRHLQDLTSLVTNADFPFPKRLKLRLQVLWAGLTKFQEPTPIASTRAMERPRPTLPLEGPILTAATLAKLRAEAAKQDIKGFIRHALSNLACFTVEDESDLALKEQKQRSRQEMILAYLIALKKPQQKALLAMTLTKKLFSEKTFTENNNYALRLTIEANAIQKIKLRYALTFEEALKISRFSAHLSQKINLDDPCLSSYEFGPLLEIWIASKNSWLAPMTKAILFSQPTGLIEASSFSKIWCKIISVKLTSFITSQQPSLLRRIFINLQAFLGIAQARRAQQYHAEIAHLKTAITNARDLANLQHILETTKSTIMPRSQVYTQLQVLCTKLPSLSTAIDEACNTRRREKLASIEIQSTDTAKAKLRALKSERDGLPALLDDEAASLRERLSFLRAVRASSLSSNTPYSLGPSKRLASRKTSQPAAARIEEAAAALKEVAALLDEVKKLPEAAGVVTPLPTDILHAELVAAKATAETKSKALTIVTTTTRAQEDLSTMISNIETTQQTLTALVREIRSAADLRILLTVFDNPRYAAYTEYRDLVIKAQPSSLARHSGGAPEVKPIAQPAPTTSRTATVATTPTTVATTPIATVATGMRALRDLVTRSSSSAEFSRATTPAAATATIIKSSTGLKLSKRRSPAPTDASSTSFASSASFEEPSSELPSPVVPSKAPPSRSPWSFFRKRTELATPAPVRSRLSDTKAEKIMDGLRKNVAEQATARTPTFIR